MKTEAVKNPISLEKNQWTQTIFSLIKKQIFMSNFTDLLISALAGPLEVVATTKLTELLQKIEPAETRKNICNSLYVPIDTELERLTTESKNKIDDAIVGALKGSIEAVAAADGFTLPNTDND